MEENHLEGQITIINNDVKELCKLFPGKYFDVITCNPPYFKYNDNSKENNTYYLDYYEDGHRTREKIPKKLAREKYNFGGIYAGTGKDDLHRYDNMISAIVTSVNSELFKLEYCD